MITLKPLILKSYFWMQFSTFSLVLQPCIGPPLFTYFPLQNIVACATVTTCKTDNLSSLSQWPCLTYILVVIVVFGDKALILIQFHLLLKTCDMSCFISVYSADSPCKIQTLLHKQKKLFMSSTCWTRSSTHLWVVKCIFKSFITRNLVLIYISNMLFNCLCQVAPKTQAVK